MFRAAIALCLGATLAASAVAGSLTLENAWVRALPPTQSATAGYLRVTNSGTESVRITGAEASAAGRVSIHESRTEGNVMRMVPVVALPLPPGSSLTLAPGGLHLMLQDLARMPAAGESLQLCLLTDRGERSCTDAEARRTAPGDDHHAHH